MRRTKPAKFLERATIPRLQHLASRRPRDKLLRVLFPGIEFDEIMGTELAKHVRTSPTPTLIVN